tara:strand:- start:24458 stop:25063 length:606 start_codon:yes stop_codon:yes gene_type:complete
MSMVFEHIENLKRIYTDQLVVVDDNRAELGRFQGLTGTVKTVNMSGRALVEFDGNNNIGWYDIDVDFLKLVDEPVHETETVSTPVPPAEPAAPAAEASAPEAAPAEAAAPAKVDPSKMSVEDMLAAARASAAGEAAPAAAPAEPAAEEAAAPAAEPAAEEAPAEEPSEAPASGGGDAGDAQALKDSGDVDGMLKYCHSVDS